ncbi:helix-turn-helix transcriptional regulator [Buttiauxella sp. S19-1]|uniref:helix-turn-helix transcriptional regulator n=1 Tax=Buttiauxella sp. S19-1 TaxID=941430 RepID=UPI001EDBBBA8|nr:helix-turn-helix domain-containing protein [Buttiauxella sp. S19-1]
MKRNSNPKSMFTHDEAEDEYQRPKYPRFGRRGIYSYDPSNVNNNIHESNSRNHSEIKTDGNTNALIVASKNNAGNKPANHQTNTLSNTDTLSVSHSGILPNSPQAVNSNCGLTNKEIPVLDDLSLLLPRAKTLEEAQMLAGHGIITYDDVFNTGRFSDKVMFPTETVENTSEAKSLTESSAHYASTSVECTIIPNREQLKAIVEKLDARRAREKTIHKDANSTPLAKNTADSTEAAAHSPQTTKNLVTQGTNPNCDLQSEDSMPVVATGSVKIPPEQLEMFKGIVLLSVKQIAVLFNITVKSINKNIAEGKFPTPVKFSDRITRFRLIDLEQYIESMSGCKVKSQKK